MWYLYLYLYLTMTIRIRKIRLTGGSLAVTLERRWLKSQDLEAGDEVVLHYGEDDVLIEPLVEFPRRKEESP